MLMSDNAQQQFPDELNHIYATLNQQDVEQFYAGYQLWCTRQRIITLQEQIGSLRQQISENAERLQQVQPPAVAFATLARLQAKGVNDIDLLDRMLERGEEWLDLTMQRLDYCEQLDFIHDNYAQWCENALEGAYDWIDSLRDAYADTTPRLAVTTEVDEASVEVTEELLLQKFASEEEWEEEVSSFEEPVTPSEAPEARPVQEATLQEPEMAFPTEEKAEAETSLVSSKQASEDEYVEFAPTVEAETEEAGSPQGPETSFPVQGDAEADSLPASSEQVGEGEFVEFAPPSQVSLPIEANAETDLPQGIYDAPQELEIQLPAEEDTEAASVLTSGEEAPSQEHAGLISSPEASLPAEASPTADASPTLLDQITSPEHIEPTSLPEDFQLDTPAGTEFAANEVVREEPIPSRVDTTHNRIDVQASIPEDKDLPAQEVKQQQRRSFWRRFLAIFWP
jgi:hypothetical protein